MNLEEIKKIRPDLYDRLIALGKAKNDIDQEEIIEEEDNVVKSSVMKYKQIIYQKAANFRDIVGNELDEGVQYRIVTNMSFNAVTVIQYIIENNEIEELYIVVYRMNNKAFDYLSDIVNKFNIKTGFVLSIFFRENKRYEKWAYDLKQLAIDKENVRVAFVNSHAKVFLAKTKCGKHIVFEGSGNLSHNERTEQYIIENNKQTYDFHKDWIDEILIREG